MQRLSSVKPYSNTETNKVTHEKRKSLVERLAGAFINPFTAILFCLALVSTMTDMVFPYFSLLGSTPEDFDPLTVIIILTMVMISGTLRFVQESRSGNAAEKLLAMITTTCTVTRREQEKTEIPMEALAVGDIVHLSAGDMIPADVRILDAKDLFVSQASLTGESEPVEKDAQCERTEAERDRITQTLPSWASNVVSGKRDRCCHLCRRPYFVWLYGIRHCRRSGGDQLYQGRQRCFLGTDPLHAGHGSAGILHQWHYER